MKTNLNPEGNGPQGGLKPDRAATPAIHAREGNARVLKLPKVEPWPEAVDGRVLLDELKAALERFVVLPKWAAETLALWVVHRDGGRLKERCLRWVADHAAEIAGARPAIPAQLNDRAADIWEPLLALADLAGGAWAESARQAAIGLSTSSQEGDPMASLLLDIFKLFAVNNVDRALSRALAAGLDGCGDRPWMARRKGSHTTELWLAQQLRPYGIHPRCVRVSEGRGRGYFLADLTDACRRYVPRSEVEALRREFAEEHSAATATECQGQPHHG